MIPRFGTLFVGRSLVVTAVAALALATIVFFRPSTAQEKRIRGEPSKRPLRLSPSELFQGDLKRLEPHSGLTASGCFKLDCSVSGLPEGSTAPPLPVQVQLQLWEEGKARSLSSMTPSLSDPCELSISVREVPQAKEGVKYRVTAALGGKGGNSFATEDVPLPKAEKELQPRFLTIRKLEKKVEVKPKESVAVWVFACEKGTGKAVADESFEQVAKRVEWALLLSVSVAEKK
jgi:hypothetical protein